jgi:hypothetical protein
MAKLEAAATEAAISFATTSFTAGRSLVSDALLASGAAEAAVASC